jgi:hypothetical protein
LYCGGTNISSINIGNCKKLVRLDVANNPNLKKLDISNNVAMDDYFIYDDGVKLITGNTFEAPSVFYITGTTGETRVKWSKVEGAKGYFFVGKRVDEENNVKWSGVYIEGNSYSYSHDLNRNNEIYVIAVSDNGMSKCSKVVNLDSIYDEGKCYSENTPLTKAVVNGKSGWYKIKDDKLDNGFTGIAKATSGKWYFVKDGVLDKSYTGIAQATNGTWYYVKKGVIDRNFSGKIVQATNGKWYYVNKGKPTKSFTGKIAQTTDGKWYYCTNGRPDKKFSGKLAYCTNGNWYYVTNGMIDRSYTGIAEATNGNLYYAKKGALDRTFTGTAKYKGKTYNVVNGVVKK